MIAVTAEGGSRKGLGGNGKGFVATHDEGKANPVYCQPYNQLHHCLETMVSRD